jgi:imidazolonepropionase-like amidohydrolase
MRRQTSQRFEFWEGWDIVLLTSRSKAFGNTGGKEPSMNWKILAVIVAVFGSKQVMARDGNVLIRHARVFDGLRMLGLRDVMVQGGRITAIGRHLGAPREFEVIDAQRRVLLPGLIDGHVHVFPGAQRDALRFGVTTVFDMYSLADRPTINRWRAQREWNSEVAEADTFTAGIGATPPGGHPTELMKDLPLGMAPPPTLAADDDAGAFMRARVDAGSDFIKVLQDDGGRPDRAASLPAFTQTRFAAVVAAAKATGKRVVVHVQKLLDAKVAIASGADALEHAVCDAPLDDALVKDMKDKGVAQTATLATYAGIAGLDDARRLAADPTVAPYLSQQQRGMLELVWTAPRAAEFAIAAANTGRLASAGVTIIAGSDTPNPTTTFGPSLHLELALMVRAGLTPTQALMSATSAPAAFFGVKDRGRIAPGLKADLVLLDGDPTQDIAATHQIVAIWKNGYAVNRRPN